MMGSLFGSASTVSGLCPIAGPTQCVSPVQCAAYDAQKHINRRSIAIFAASHAEGRWFDPSRDHPSDVMNMVCALYRWFVLSGSCPVVVGFVVSVVLARSRLLATWSSSSEYKSL